LSRFVTPTKATMQDIRDLIQNGRFEQAEIRLRDRLNDAPDDPEVLNMYGVVLSRKGDALGARSYFKRASEAAPDEPSYLVNYGLLLAQQGDSLRASEFLERAAALDPNWSRGHAQLGELALAAGQIDEAAQRFRTALRADPDDAHAQVGLAQVTLIRGDADQALKLAQPAVARLPKDARAQSVLGMVLMAKGHHAFARQAMENALGLEPRNQRIRRLAARAQLADGAAAAAVTTISAVTDFEEGDAAMLADLCEQALRAGHHADIIKLLDRALVRVSSDPRLIHAAAEARVRSGRMDDAISLLGAYSGPDAHPSVWTHRLGLLARQSRFDDAYQLARDWAEAQPHHADAHAELATGAELRGEAALARSAADKALALDATQPKALCLAAAYELKSGKPGAHCNALTGLDASKLNAAARATRGFLLGLAADRLGDSDGAVARWLEVHNAMPKQRMPALADPLGQPRELPMPLSKVEGRPVVFVPYIPGTGAEVLLRALAQGESIAVLTDRLGANGRHDGLSADQRGQIENGLGEGTLHLFRRRYWRALDRLKLPAARLPLDVLPSLEWVQYAALSGALPQARVLAFVRDPRDTLLHWLAFGTTPARPIGKPELAANYLLRQYQHIDRMRSSAGLAVTVIRAEDFDSDRNALRDRLGEALGVAPSSLVLDAPQRQVLAGLPERLQSGRWRQYAAPLGKAFRLLATAARSFGYD
jgi:Flp pilus assembly protein TadD